VPDGTVPFPMPLIPPGPEPPVGAVPFIIPAGGVPEGAVPFIPPMAVLFISAMGEPDGVPAAACSFPVTDADGVPEDDDVVVELCVQPAIRIPAMRSADPISISIVLFFMEYITWTVGIPYKSFPFLLPCHND